MNEYACWLRTGQTVDFVTGLGQLTKARLHACLPPVIARDILLVTDDHPAYPTFARELGIMHEAVNLRAAIRVRGTVHVQNVNAYHRRLRGWLRAFHGIATRCLPNYLGWRWILDARRIMSPESLLKSSFGVFPQLNSDIALKINQSLLYSVTPSTMQGRAYYLQNAKNENKKSWINVHIACCTNAFWYPHHIIFACSQCT